MRVLTIDVGGTNVKCGLTHATRVKIPSGPTMTPRRMVAAVDGAMQGIAYDAVTIGYPGLVVHGHIALDPHNLGGGWVRFDFAKAFKRPVRVVNDAALQALGSYQGGRMLFLGLGTGLGSALMVGGVLQPMELAHLPFRNGKTYEDFVGLRGLRRLGTKKWRSCVAEVVKQFKAALEADYVVLGGGNAKLLDPLPEGARLGHNSRAFTGGQRIWTKKFAGAHR